MTRFYDEALSRMAAVGGVQAIGATDTLPFSGDWSTTSFAVEGYQPPKGQPSPWGDVRGISAGYHPAMGIRLLRGRFISDTDRPDSRQVTVVDDETVRRYWPNSDPIGKRITFDDPTKPPVKWIEVVGVVAHTAHEGLDAERRTQMYFSRAQFPSRNMYIAARTTRDPMSLTPDLRRALASVDRDVPLYQVKTMEELMETAVGQRRLAMVLLAAFAGTALLLAALGIFGVIWYRRHPADAGAGSQDGARCGPPERSANDRVERLPAGRHRARDRTRVGDCGRATDRIAVVRDHDDRFVHRMPGSRWDWRRSPSSRSWCRPCVRRAVDPMEALRTNRSTSNAGCRSGQDILIILRQESPSPLKIGLFQSRSNRVGRIFSFS